MSEPIQLTLNNNFYVLTRSMLFGEPAGTQTSIGATLYQNIPTIGTYKDIDGNVRSTMIRGRNNNYSGYVNLGYFGFPNTSRGSNWYNANSVENQVTFEVGSGDTAVSMEDYVLIDQYNSIPSNQSVDLYLSATASSEAGGIIFNASVYNVSESDITIREIGLFKKIYYTDANGCIVLVGRTVLPEEEQVTLHNGDSKTFTICLSLPNPPTS